MTKTETGLSKMLCFDVYATNLAFGRVYAPMLGKLGLTYPQYLVLVTLWATDGLGVGEIGARLGLNSSTLTPLLKRLESDGLLRRNRDSQDERRVRVDLTDRGREMKAMADSIPECIAKAVGMSPEDVAALQGNLSRLRHALEEAQPQG